jgi:uncharacterized membrane protein YbjE (DUF340 family)
LAKGDLIAKGGEGISRLGSLTSGVVLDVRSPRKRVGAMEVILFLAAGVIVGYLFRSKRTFLTGAGIAAMWSLYLLIFLLGISVGANESAIRAFGRLGWQAFVLCTGGIVGSILVSCIVSRTFFASIGHEK